MPIHYHRTIFYVSRMYNYISMFCLLITLNPCKIAFIIYFSISCIFVRGPDFRTKVIDILIIKLFSISKENITQFIKWFLNELRMLQETRLTSSPFRYVWMDLFNKPAIRSLMHVYPCWKIRSTERSWISLCYSFNRCRFVFKVCN